MKTFHILCIGEPVFDDIAGHQPPGFFCVDDNLFKIIVLQL